MGGPTVTERFFGSAGAAVADFSEAVLIPTRIPNAFAKASGSGLRLNLKRDSAGNVPENAPRAQEDGAPRLVMMAPRAGTCGAVPAIAALLTTELEDRGWMVTWLPWGRHGDSETLARIGTSDSALRALLPTGSPTDEAPMGDVPTAGRRA